tara:strand:+ start:169 stop:708 length:540 start_codon:yes stop_codon:yes gene_type:complete
MPGGGKMYDSMPGGGRLMDYMMAGGKLMMGKKGLKMVKNDKGEMVPFFAADGKGKMEAGGKMMRGYKMGQEGMKNDPPRYTKNDLRRQVEGLRRERDKMLSSKFVRKDSMFAQANPKLSGLDFGRVTGEKTSAQITNFYDTRIKNLVEGFEKDNPDVPDYNREEFLKMIEDDMEKKGEI